MDEKFTNSLYPPFGYPVNEKADIEYKVQSAAYFKEQRALIDKQVKYTTWTMIASITIAIATIVYAIFAVLQYFKQ